MDATILQGGRLRNTEDREQVNELVVSFVPQLRCYARSLTGGVEHADDLVQDCLERAFQRVNQWQQGTNMRAWLFTIMHNIHANQARRYNNGPTFVAMDDLDIQNISSEQGAHEVLLRDLETALSSLSAAHREVIHLVCVEEMKYEDVAAVLCVPVGTVMSRLYRAREVLRSFMMGESNADLGAVS